MKDQAHRFVDALVAARLSAVELYQRQPAELAPANAAARGNLLKVAVEAGEDRVVRLGDGGYQRIRATDGDFF